MLLLLTTKAKVPPKTLDLRAKAQLEMKIKMREKRKKVFNQNLKKTQKKCSNFLNKLFYKFIFFVNNY